MKDLAFLSKFIVIAELRAAIMATEQTRVAIIKKEKQGIVSAQCPTFMADCFAGKNSW